MSLYQVAEHCPVRSESLQPHAERSSRPGPGPPSVEADVYVWCYALLVVHARKEEERHLQLQSRRKKIKGHPTNPVLSRKRLLNQCVCVCVLLAVSNMPVNLLSPHSISNSSMLSNVHRVNLPAVVVTASPHVALPLVAQRATAPNGKTFSFLDDRL